MNFRAQWRRGNERGYILLTLMLFVALLTIGFLTMIQRIDTQIKRDREEELIHRGVQYSRAVRRYFKKFGRYPNRIEELEKTNNLRFLRKRYKDPITGKDFKPLHVTDVQMSFVAGAASGLPPGLGPNVSAAGGLNGAAASTGGLGQSATASENPQGGGDQSPASDASPPGQPISGAQATSGASDASPPGQQVFGGGAIVGVVSASKDKTIREFNKKDHYNQWQFIYDPTTDRGGLLMTPNQPPLKGATANPANSTQQGTPGQNQNGTNPAAGSAPQQPNSQPEQQ